MFKGDIATTGGRMAAWSDSLFVDHAVFRLVWSNWAEVAPGRLYRCNHPTAWRLAGAQRKLGIKTGGGIYSYTPAQIQELQSTRARKLVAVRKALRV